MWFIYNEQFNIAVTTEGFKEQDLKLFFGDEPVWIIHPKLTFREIFEDLEFMPYYRMFGIHQIPYGYNENLLEYAGNYSFKFCTYKPK